MNSLRLDLRDPDGKIFQSNDRKLLLIRPSSLTWFLFGGIVVGGFAVAAFLVESVWIQFLFIVVPLAVGCYLLGDFQDWVLDRQEGKAVVTKYNLLDWVCGRVRCMHRFPLDDVAAVHATDDFRLELMLASGESAASVAIPTTNHQEIEALRYSLSTFLCLEDTLVFSFPANASRFSLWPHFIKR